MLAFLHRNEVLIHAFSWGTQGSADFCLRHIIVAAGLVGALRRRRRLFVVPRALLHLFWCQLFIERIRRLFARLAIRWRGHLSVLFPDGSLARTLDDFLICSGRLHAKLEGLW